MDFVVVAIYFYYAILGVNVGDDDSAKYSPTI